MNITVVCDVLGLENNGVTIAAMNLIRFLKSRNHNVRVLCADESKLGQDGYFVVPSRSFGPFDDYLEKNGITLAKPVEMVVRNAIANVDIVHVMLPFSLGFAAVKIAKEYGIPVCAGFHQLAENFSVHLKMDRVPLVNKITYAHFHRFYKDVDCIHYVSQYVRSVYEEMYGKTVGCVISNGVNEIFKPMPEVRKSLSEDVIYIHYTGRYSYEKSHKTLIDAVEYSKYKDKIQLVFAGNGPIKDELEKYSAKLPLKPIFGFYSRQELVERLNMATLYVHAAEYEAEGIGCLEAISCGIVPVISDSPKCATRFYAIDDKSLFECNNPQNLAEKIDFWLDNPEIREEYSKRYIKMAESDFDHNSCMMKMEEMFEKTIRDYKSDK